MSRLIFTEEVEDALIKLIDEMKPTGVFTVTDENVAPSMPQITGSKAIVIPAGDENKTLESLAHVWRELSANGATRRSLVINFGGGVVTDLGGFAAATFKRGVRFVNVPTTVLSAVDAAVGGKTGINFGGLKNEVGTFRVADAVVISTRYFSTLPDKEVRSGKAEMLKHALLTSSKAVADFMEDGLTLDSLEQSVMVKQRIVDQDPTEQGLRKALNLGHTAGHAFESLAIERGEQVPHGYAVAWGLVVALVLSQQKEGFDSGLMHAVAAYIKEWYGAPAITCNDYDELLRLMHHDKKNARPNETRFTLLAAPGEPIIDCNVDDEDIRTVLDITRDLLE